jgi:hypothetical protein
MRSSIKLLSAALLLVLCVQSDTQARGYGTAWGSVAVGPGGGGAVHQAAGGVAAGPFGGVQAGAARSTTYVGPGGATIQHGSAVRVSQGSLGGVHTGGVQGTRISTPGGGTYTRTSTAGVSVGPFGGVQTYTASGAAVGAPFGGAAVAQRAGVSVGGYGGVAVGSRTVAVENTTTYVSPNTLRAMAHVARSPYYTVYTPTFYQVHTTAWATTRWVGAGLWVPPTWSAVSVYCDVTAPPMAYDYGSTVVIENNYVYINGEQVSTCEEYADQAIRFMDRGRRANPADNEEWQALGVFGMIQGEETTAQHVFQLAVNKAGVIRGNYYNAVADNNLPVYGSLDADSQRVCWSIGEKKDIVFEAGLNNLTQDRTPGLTHYGKERTAQMVLVRLEEPKDGKK